MGTQAAALSGAPLDAAAVARAASEGAAGRAAGHGAIVTFLGTVRAENVGRHVIALEYEAYEPLALRCFERIIAEASGYWPSARVAVHHRVGRLAIGEASVVIAAAAPHRAEAFAACRFAIERVKQIAPVWKREFFEGGDAWIEGASVDPDDEAAREEARRRSCA